LTTFQLQINPYYVNGASAAARHAGLERPEQWGLPSFATAVESRPYPPPAAPGRSQWEVALENLHNTIEGSRSVSVSGLRGYTPPHLEHLNRAAHLDHRGAELANHSEPRSQRPWGYAREHRECLNVELLTPQERALRVGFDPAVCDAYAAQEQYMAEAISGSAAVTPEAAASDTLSHSALGVGVNSALQCSSAPPHCSIWEEPPSPPLPSRLSLPSGLPQG